MKINRFLGIASLALALSSSGVTAQYYHPVTVSGFTQDVIANGVGNANTSTTTSVDAVDFAYVSRDFQATATSPVLTYGLPVTGQFMTVNTTTPGLTYQLAPYGSSNALKLSATGDAGTLTFATPTAAYNLYFLATGGSGSGVVSATVTFSDATTQAFTNLAVSDWYDQPNFAIQGIGRINIVTNALEDGAGVNPRIYQIPLAITAANQSKTVQSIAFSKTSGSGYVNIFGVSADKYTTCLAPTAVVASALLANSGTLSWTAPATAPSSYDVYYTSSTVAPNSTTVPSTSGITALTVPMNSLSSQTKYHVWIRSNCAGNLGQWAYGTTFTTPCSTFAVPYSENFDTTATGGTTNTNAPLCWSYLETSGFAGYGYVTTGNANSPTKNYYLYNSSAATGNQLLVSPETIALSDGTKRVKFYAKGGAAGFTLQVGTLTNPADPATFVSFNTTTLTAAQAQYTVNIPSGGGAYLAFRHNLGATFRAIYLDDIIVETIPSCVEPIALMATGQTTNSISLSWTNNATVPAANYDIYYSTINTAPTSGTVLNATNSFSSTTTTATVPGLITDTMYYFWVRARCSTTDQSIWVGSVSGFTGYCKPSSTNQNSWISAFTTTGAATNMTYSSASAVTGTGGYQNLSESTNIVANGAGTTTSLSITAGGPTCGVAIWVDFNNDLTFSATERLFVTPGYVTTTAANASIAIPAGTPLGSYRMRVMCDYNVSAPSNPCIAMTRGETIDFKLQVVDVLGTSETTSVDKKLSIHPNPFKDVIYISETKEVKSVTVYDVAGRVVKQLNDASKEIHLTELKEGLYMIKVTFKDGTESVTKAIKK